jgi:DNA replication protein DnaC
MTTTDDVVTLLKKLRLSGVLQTLELRCRQAVDDNVPHREFLFRVLSDELERRESNQLDQRVRRAAFEHLAALEDFDFAFNPKIPKSKVVDLATCAFVERRQNALLLGQTGVGKSHVAQAIGHRACRAGYTVLYLPASDLFKQLRAAKADGSHDRKLARVTSHDLLIIDDLGLRPLSGEEALDLYEIIRTRYQKASLLLTSNRDEAEIARLFGEPLLASAAMDRLLHDAHVVLMEGDSFRNPPPNRPKSPLRPSKQPNA